MRVFAIVLIAVGVALVSTAFALFTNIVVSRRIERSLGRRQVPGMVDHIVVIGLGSVGIAVVQGLIAEGQRVVVVADATQQETHRMVNLSDASAVSVLTSADLTNIETGLAIGESLGERLRGALARVAARSGAGGGGWAGRHRTARAQGHVCDGEAMTNGAAVDDMRRVVTCDLTFEVSERAEVAVQIVVAESAGQVVNERFDVATDGGPPASLEEICRPQGERIHVIAADPGRLTVAYRAEILARSPQAADSGASAGSAAYERQLYLRPSRYCPSDHLIGFAVAEFGTGAGVGTVSRVADITEWIRGRISYVPGSSDVHDSAEHTLLTGMGTCRDFAHLGIALCRATGIPARFAAVYAPGLLPMDFHAVFETLQLGRWCVHDATGLAPRPSLVRIATGRDAADAAFSAVNSGVAELENLEVSATVGAATLPRDNQSQIVELA